MGSDSTQKRSRREVLVFPGKDGDFAIDQDDYIIVSSILLGRKDRREWQDLVEVEDNHERRVCKLLLEDDTIGLIPSSIVGKLEKLTDLSLRFQYLKSFPPFIGQLRNLEHLELFELFGCTTCPEEIGNLANLKKLILKQSDISCLPPSIGQLRNLEELDLSYNCKLLSLPEEIGNLSKLYRLTLFCCPIKSLPPSIGGLQNLQELDLSNTDLLSLPVEIGNLVSLIRLYLSGTCLPPSIGQLRNLEELDLSYNRKLLSLPEEIGNLSKLYRLTLFCCPIKSLPPSIGGLQNLQELDLSHTDLLSLPVEMGYLVSLIRLYLSGTTIISLPRPILRLKDIEDLIFSFKVGELPSLPEELGTLQNLFCLILEDIMCIRKLPEGGYFKLLCNLVKSCRLLGALQVRTKSPSTEEISALGFALSCNRLRSKACFLNKAGVSDGEVVKLWPFAIYKVIDGCNRYTDSDDPLYCSIETIYQFLCDNKDSLVIYQTTRS